MASNIVIKLDTTRYKKPQPQDIKKGKDYVLKRNEHGLELADKIDSVLDNMIESIVTICYKYNVVPKYFTISSKYNDAMMDEISEIMDEIEQEIINLIFAYSTLCTEDKDRKALLIAWISTLGRNNDNFTTTTERYLQKTMLDTEAAIAALRAAGISMAEAVNLIKLYKHQIYTMPAILEAFKHNRDFAAQYIQTLGVQAGAVGISNCGATNVTNMAKTTLQMVWMRSLGMDYEADGAVGYICFRGSDFPCQKCDDVCGYVHDIKEGMCLPVHPGCCCAAFPIYAIDVQLNDLQ